MPTQTFLDTEQAIFEPGSELLIKSGSSLTIELGARADILNTETGTRRSLFLETGGHGQIDDISKHSHDYLIAGRSGILQSLIYVFNDDPGEGALTFNLLRKTQLLSTRYLGALNIIKGGAVGVMPISPQLAVGEGDILKLETFGTATKPVKLKVALKILLT